tara:strand:- start:3337 stop:4236 length:900 start_codon:yes stop_codon:yes gene_type:complete
MKMATNPYDSVGKAVQTQANKAQSQLQNGAQASVQQFVGDKLNTGMGFIDSAIKNITSEVFNALGFAKQARSINLPSSETGKVDSKVGSGFESTTRGSDWRVKLSIPASPQNMNANLLAPLQKTGGLCFPITPTIIISHSANYNTLQPVHTNYPFQIYENSQADDIVITGEFPVENAEDAKYWIAAIQYLRSVTKMFYGESSADAGSPPPVVRLNGYGDYIFNNVPVVIANFTVDLPADVDYIAANLDGKDVEGATSWVPTNSQISVTLKPTFSRRRTSEFNLQKFVDGEYISSGEGFI